MYRGVYLLLQCDNINANIWSHFRLRVQNSDNSSVHINKWQMLHGLIKICNHMFTVYFTFKMLGAMEY